MRTYAMIKMFGMFAVLGGVLTGNAWGETIQGEVQSVNANQRTIQFVPEKEQDPMTLRVPAYAQFSGIDTLNELEAGDTIKAEVEPGIEGQPTAQRVEVKMRDDETAVPEVTEEPDQVAAIGEPLGVEAEPEIFEDTSLETFAWNEKLSRGVVNVVTSPLEIPRNIDKVGSDKGPAYGWTVGLVQGAATTILRAGAGLVDTLTFPFNWPNGRKAPLMSPEYAWEEWEID
jgi:putative exosortase-associated protein (TIGR04073 family)